MEAVLGHPDSNKYLLFMRASFLRVFEPMATAPVVPWSSFISQMRSMERSTFIVKVFCWGIPHSRSRFQLFLFWFEVGNYETIPFRYFSGNIETFQSFWRRWIEYSTWYGAKRSVAPTGQGWHIAFIRDANLYDVNFVEINFLLLVSSDEDFLRIDHHFKNRVSNSWDF